MIVNYTVIVSLLKFPLQKLGQIYAAHGDFMSCVQQKPCTQRPKVNRIYQKKEKKTGWHCLRNNRTKLSFLMILINQDKSSARK